MMVRLCPTRVEIFRNLPEPSETEMQGDNIKAVKDRSLPLLFQISTLEYN
jgi:hypothetical protein